MKHIITLVCAVLASSIAFASSTTGLNKGSAQLKALSSAWKNHASTNLQPGKDINIVYGGDDVERPAFNLHSITA